MAEKKRWVREVKTVSTFPPRGLFNKDADTIARTRESDGPAPSSLTTSAAASFTKRIALVTACSSETW